MTTVGAGWNGVAGDSRSFRRKLTEFWKAICGGAEKTGGFWGIASENVSENVNGEQCVCV
jgi:hypothetical protein